MNLALLTLTACLCLAQGQRLFNPEVLEYLIKTRNTDVKTVPEIRSKLNLLNRYWNRLITKKGSVYGADNKTNGGFSWSNCGSTNDIVKINQLRVSPSPIKTPGSVDVSFDVDVKENITSPLKLSLVMEKHALWVWVKIPCIQDIGSCDYSDICSLIPKPCPELIAKTGLPCQCPVPGRNYKLPSTTFQIPNVPLPSIIENGNYRVTVHGSMHGVPLFCYKIELSLDKS